MSNEFVPSPEFLARAKRVQDAVELRQPDRIPINLGFGYFLADYGGVTRQELYENLEKAQEILEELAIKLEPDMAMGAWGSPEPSRILGDRMTKWPGYGLGEQGSFQFDEHEFMKAEDYDVFLNDPSDFAIRKYLPRAFKGLEALSMLPPLGMSLFGYYNLSNTGVFLAPPVAEAFATIAKAAQAQAAFTNWQIESGGRMAALGFPGPTFLMGSLIEAPYDFMSDTLRGMRGIMLDMLRIPDKLLEAEKRVLEIQVEHAISFSAATGMNAAFIPLHRGSDGFMSLKQFEKFYWPQLKEMIVRLVEAGITPSVYYEGAWDQRLEYLAELPKGKTVGLFQHSDIFKVKEVVGDTMCIVGGMPNSMLVGSTVEQVREHTQEVCERVGKGGGFIMSTEVMELEGCNLELIEAWVEATKEFGGY